MTKENNKKRKGRAPGYKNPARYRLDFIKENTLNTLWSVRMTRTRVWIVSLASLAAIMALLWVVVAFTPLRQLLPGALKGDLPAVDVTDSLLAASEAEMQFVRSYEEEERFNISVLAPIAAEGMVFSSPLPSAISLSDIVPTNGIKGITATANAVTPVSAVYRGTVISVATGADGLSTVTVQHPNDFLSVYQGLGDVFVEKGSKVEAARRIGNIPSKGRVVFELWHKGSPLDPAEFIAI